MLLRDHQHMVINVSIVVDERVNTIGHKELLLAEGRIKGGYAGGITSIRSSSSMVSHIVESLSRPKLNTECAHEVGCLVESATIPINYISHSFCVAGERGYDAEELLNLKNICDNLPGLPNGREHYHIHLTTVIPREEGEEVRVVLKI